MKLRTKFLVFLILLHLLLLVLSFLILKHDRIIFIVSELFIVFSILIAWQLYNQLIKPLRLLIQGAEAIRDKDFNTKFPLTGNYEMDELILVYNEMADELRKERTKQEQQHFFLEKLIATSPTGILILDYDENIQDVNPKASKLLNIERKNVQGTSIDNIKHPLMQLIKELQSGEARSVTLNGVNTYKLQKSHFIDRGFARHFVMIEELTTEILAAEKKAYGKVIRMMAHEVNNTIGPVNSILQSALESDKLWTGASNNTLQNALQVAWERNSGLSIFMRNFTEVVRLPEPKLNMIDIHQLITKIASFIEVMAKDKKIAFSYHFDNEPLLILADEQQFEQVLINIAKNSIEAIDEEGFVRFSTNTALKQLMITDNGRGVQEENANQLFSPFFSTKKDGQGIGLTLVKEVLINHGYEFSLQTINKETVFMLRFSH
jgi:two-component system, NtrC family, nitrogen regulation sensor histidine kinase NtrY